MLFLFIVYRQHVYCIYFDPKTEKKNIVHILCNWKICCICYFYIRNWRWSSMLWIHFHFFFWISTGWTMIELTGLWFNDCFEIYYFVKKKLNPFTVRNKSFDFFFINFSFDLYILLTFIFSHLIDTSIFVEIILIWIKNTNKTTHYWTTTKKLWTCERLVTSKRINYHLRFFFLLKKESISWKQIEK